MYIGILSALVLGVIIGAALTSQRNKKRQNDLLAELTQVVEPVSPHPANITPSPQTLREQLQHIAQLFKHQANDLHTLQTEHQHSNELLQLTINDLTTKEFALNQHAIVSITDLLGNIIYANEKFSQISQYSNQELIGRNHRLLKSGLHVPAFYGELWNTISNGKVWHGEIANRCKDSGIYWVAATIMPLMDVNGLPNQYISISTDITIRKRTEQQLSANQKFLHTMVEKYRNAEKQISEARDRELAIGSQIQHTLLFGEIPSQLGELSLAVHTEPSKGIDGDFYQFLNYRHQCFDLSIGDVMGKGIPAALIGAAIKQQINQVITNLLAYQHASLPTPAEIINTLHQQITPRLIELESFVTLIYLRYDLQHNEVTLVDAGHTAALHCGQKGVLQLHGNNLPIGVIENECYQEVKYSLHQDDLLFLYSDGVTEARNTQGEEFGVDRLSKLIEQLRTVPASMVLQAVRLYLREFEQYEKLSDDRSCVVLKRESLHAIELPWDTHCLSTLRHSILQQAQTTSLNQDATDALVLAAVELVSNVIRHSTKLLPNATICCNFEPYRHGLTLNLYYLGKPYPPSDIEPDFSGESEGGFGLFIIQNSVDYVHYQSVNEQICWARLEKWGISE